MTKENHTLSQKTDPNKKYNKFLIPVGKFFLIVYLVCYGLAFLILILFSISTVKVTETYDYFCGNPLMEDWAQWFKLSIISGLIILPASVYAIFRRKRALEIIFLVCGSIFILLMIFMLFYAYVTNIAPDFYFFLRF
jgi:hypothetical protein